MHRAGMFASLLAAALVACDRAPAPPEMLPPSETSALPPPALRVGEAPLNRRSLLSTLDDVTSAYVAGQPYPESAAQLANARFSVRMPFACAGDSAPSAVSVNDDKARNALRVSVSPVQFEPKDALWSLLLDKEQIEHAEGFWLERPWLRSSDCPVLPSIGDGKERTFAIVQAYTSGGSRVLRGGQRGFEAVRKNSDAMRRDGAGVRLLLE
ncbi:MAG: hypothetical protein AB7M12_02170, partial [Hyphomonadaceae bacterium]